MNRTLMALTLTSNNIGDKGVAKIAEVSLKGQKSQDVRFSNSLCAFNL